MEWTQFLIMIIAMAGLFFWNHREIHALHDTISAIKDEMKDFHGRLCTLEEKYYQWLMRDK